MLLTKSSEYAMRLMFYLVQQNKKNDYSSLKKIADHVDVSFYQLTKVAQKLIQSQIIDSYTGPNGGVRLKISPDEIHLMDIIEPFEGENLFNSCLLGLAACEDSEPCPVHNSWKNIRKTIRQLFTEKTLIEINNDEQTGRLKNN